MKPARPLSNYIDFVRPSVLDVAPSQQVRSWASTWNSVFRVMADKNAIYEVPSLVIARWEFLGGLLRGTEEDTDSKDALAYSRKFLVPVNGNYAAVEKLVDRPEIGDRLDIFAMLRNKPLHGVFPSGIATLDNNHVVTWWMGFHEIALANHLTVDADGGLHIDATTLCDELSRSMAAFGDYLDSDIEMIGGRSPQGRWRRALWARFKPKFMPTAHWMQAGVTVGLPS